MSGKRLEVRVGAFACIVEGYDNPSHQFREVLAEMQRMIAEHPALIEAAPSTVADLAALKDLPEGAELSDEGLIVIRRENAPGAVEDAATVADQAEPAAASAGPAPGFVNIFAAPMTPPPDPAEEPEPAAPPPQKSAGLFGRMRQHASGAPEAGASAPEAGTAPHDLAATDDAPAETSGPPVQPDPGPETAPPEPIQTAAEPEPADPTDPLVLSEPEPAMPQAEPEAGPEAPPAEVGEPFAEPGAPTAEPEAPPIWAGEPVSEPDAPSAEPAEAPSEPVETLAEAAAPDQPAEPPSMAEGTAPFGDAGEAQMQDDGNFDFDPTAPEPAPAPAAAPAPESVDRLDELMDRLRGMQQTRAAKADAPAATRAAKVAAMKALTPADVAKLSGAQTVDELLAASAAWLTLVEAKDRFSRRDVLEVFDTLPGDHPRSLEEKIKGYGKLVRSGTLTLAGEGVFTMTAAAADRFGGYLEG